MTLCVCERCLAEFPPLAHLTEGEWLCAPCWRRAGMSWPTKLPTAEEVQSSQLAIRAAMLKAGGNARYMVLSGKAGL